MAKRTLVRIAGKHAIDHDGARMRLVELDGGGQVASGGRWQAADARTIARWVREYAPKQNPAGFKRLM